MKLTHPFLTITYPDGEFQAGESEFEPTETPSLDGALHIHPSERPEAENLLQALQQRYPDELAYQQATIDSYEYIVSDKKIEIYEEDEVLYRAWVLFEDRGRKLQFLPETTSDYGWYDEFYYAKEFSTKEDAERARKIRNKKDKYGCGKQFKLAEFVKIKRGPRKLTPPKSRIKDKKSIILQYSDGLYYAGYTSGKHHLETRLFKEATLFQTKELKKVLYNLKEHHGEQYNQLQPSAKQIVYVPSLKIGKTVNRKDAVEVDRYYLIGRYGRMTNIPYDSRDEKNSLGTHARLVPMRWGASMLMDKQSFYFYDSYHGDLSSFPDKRYTLEDATYMLEYVNKDLPDVQKYQLVEVNVLQKDYPLPDMTDYKKKENYSY